MTKKGNLSTQEAKKSLRDSLIALFGIIMGVVVDYLLQRTGIDFGPVLDPMILPLSSAFMIAIFSFFNRCYNWWRI